MSTYDPKPELTQLERLAALVREDHVDIESVSEAELADYLKDNKIEMEGPEKRFGAILKKAQARRRLEIARSRRLNAEARAKEILSAGPIAVDAVRERVRSIIEKFRECDPERAQVYAREFEKATPEDLKVLEEDLMLLEMDKPEHGEDNKQDAG